MCVILLLLILMCNVCVCNNEIMCINVCNNDVILIIILIIIVIIM